MRKRALLALIFGVAAILGTAPAQAEKRTFVIANDADGYGVDRCLATGEACGSVIAAAYCRSQDFVDALSYRKLARTEITGTANVAACRGGACNELIAIECSR